MQIPEMFKRDDAVSPVIGVILMVAITVILAAVIASFVFGMGTPETAPQASLKMSSNSDDNITVAHQGGDVIFNDTTELIVTNVSSSDVLNIDYNMPAEFSVGDSFEINGTSFTFNSTTNVKLVDTQSDQLISNQNVRF
ncbi:type IV pilin [Methanohalophilus sp. RSK]|uniref:type IV pilin n=1 Tax=Methanohalophilus sp. RSK TaxID=2485783 RepID=UPI000F43BE80|nr:type IV pilin N-terminal domain-containing protein [Methanohalophilus sp. RSK]RNI14536.1 type IV pilin [Methanohalophilus sp. RSK]